MRSKIEANEYKDYILGFIFYKYLSDQQIAFAKKEGMSDANINEFGRFDALKNSVDEVKAKTYFEQRDGQTLSTFKLNIKIDKLLQNFILTGETSL